MTTLHLGVTVLPYADKSGTTTGDVAEILEARYGIMQSFVDTLGEEAITKALEMSARNAVEAIMMGSNSAGLNLTAEGEQEIETAFRLYLEQDEMAGRVAGVPTQAALKGVNHRLKHPNAKGNPERVSFIDTGLYEASMKAWTET